MSFRSGPAEVPLVVPKAALDPFEVAAEHLGLSVEEVYGEFAGWIEVPPEEVAWRDFAAIQSRLGASMSAPELKTVGRAVMNRGVIHRTSRAVGLFISPQAFIMNAAVVNLRRMFPFMVFDFRREGAAVVVDWDLPPEAEPCPSFFLINVGCFEACTRLIGLDDCRVEYQLRKRGLHMVVRPPPSGTLWAVVRRTWAALRNSEANVEELTEQYATLAARNLELKRALEERQVAWASRDRFLQTIGHELRTPMNGLSNGLGELRSELGRDHPVLDIVERSAERLIRTLETSLAYSKYTSEKVRPQLSETSLSAFLSEVVETSGGKGRIEVVASPGWYAFDQDHTRRALTEVLTNALQSNPTASVELRARSKENSLTFEVLDRGPGIPEDQQEEVLKPFVQLGEGEARSSEGMGLGLSLCKAAVEGIGGHLHLENGEGDTGLVVRIGIPASAVRTPTERTRPERPRVLVVDDDRINRMVARRLLDKLGFEIELAEDGSICLERMAGGQYDLVLMDCEMPTLDGWETTRRLRKSGCTTPIVAATAYAGEADRQRCRDAGMDDFLSKPLNRARLQNVLSRWLAA